MLLYPSVIIDTFSNLNFLSVLCCIFELLYIFKVIQHFIRIFSPAYPEDFKADFQLFLSANFVSECIKVSHVIGRVPEVVQLLKSYFKNHVLRKTQFPFLMPKQSSTLLDTLISLYKFTEKSLFMFKTNFHFKMHGS